MTVLGRLHRPNIVPRTAYYYAGQPGRRRPHGQGSRAWAAAALRIWHPSLGVRGLVGTACARRQEDWHSHVGQRRSRRGWRLERPRPWSQRPGWQL